jgi:hypothetical protein
MILTVGAVQRAASKAAARTLNQSIYSGKKASGGCTMPTDAQLETLLNQYISMQAMLTQGAVDAFTDKQ